MINKLVLALFSVIIFSLSSIALAQDENLLPAPIPKRISGGVVNGKATNLPKPVYPAAALAAGISGSVNVAIVISKSGSVMSARAVSGHPLLKAAAVEAAQKATFAPTTLIGQPVEVSGVIVYNFVKPTPKDKTRDEIEDSSVGYGKGIGIAEGADLTVGKKHSEVDEKLTTLMLSTILSAYEFIGNEPELDKIIMEMMKVLPTNDEDFQADRDFKNKTYDEKKQIVNGIRNALKKDLDNSELWQYRMGLLLGEMMGKFGNFENQLKLIEKGELNILLSKIRDLTFSAPPDFPESVLEKLKKVGDFSNRKDLELRATQIKIFQTVEQAF